ncbi:MAG: hypothetical protein ACRDD3_06380 [Azovibrio sp.]
MPYVKRDTGGAIVSLHREPVEGGVDFLSYDNPEIDDFLGVGEKSRYLEKMDMDFIRVIEDVIDLLLDRNVIIFTDLPAAVQKKLTVRRSVRGSALDSAFANDVVELP